MSDICTATANPSGCGHYNVTVSVDGVAVALHVSSEDIASPLTADELSAFVLLSLRRLRAKGVTLAQMARRITYGDEATNVKQYDILGAGGAVTKTNIGAAYVDVLPGANGQRALVDFTGATDFRVVLTANLVGTGQFAARLVRDSDSAVIFEAANLGAAGERELDTGWLPVPGSVSGLEVVRLQAKSQTAADDPTFRRCVVLVR